jgi:hypothetical protein
MIDEKYHELVDYKFKEYAELVKSDSIRSVAIVIVNNDLRSQVDTFGIPDIALIGALDYCKHRILVLNSEGEETKILSTANNAND